MLIAEGRGEDHTIARAEAYRRERLRYSKDGRRGFDGVDPNGRAVVLEIRSDKPALVAEAKLIMALSHDALAPMRDAGSLDDGWFVATDRWSGPSLERALRKKPIAPDDVVALLQPIASGLDCLHRAGVMHRAVCAANLVVSDPASPRLWIVGNPSGPAAGAPSEGADTLVLKAPEGLDYVPPDLLDGAARPDVYALAVLAFRLLAGDLPFRRYPTLTQTLVERQQRPAAALAEIARRPVHPALEEWARASLACDPKLRPPTADALIANLAEAAGVEGVDHEAAVRRVLARASDSVPPRATVMGARAVRVARATHDPSSDTSPHGELEVSIDVDVRIDSMPPPALSEPPAAPAEADRALETLATTPAGVRGSAPRALAWWIGVLLLVVAVAIAAISAAAR